MDVDRDAVILSKLGILQSTLKSPHRKLRSETHSLNDNRIEDDSSSSDNCFFECERVSITRSRIFRHQNRNESANSTQGFISFTLFDILCAIYLIFFSTTFTYFLFNDTIHLDEQWNQTLELKIYNFYGLAFICGILIAGVIYTWFSGYAVSMIILFIAMIISITYDRYSSKTIAGICILAIFTALIYRGVLLALHLCYCPQRVVLLIFLTISLASLLSSLIILNTSKLNNISTSPSLIHFLPTTTARMPSHAVFKREIFAVENSTATNLLFLSANSNNKLPDGLGFSKNGLSNSLLLNTTNFAATFEPKNGSIFNSNGNFYVTNATTSVLTTTTNANNRVFKTKAEQNKVMREEVERKRKEKKKLELKEDSRKAASGTTKTVTVITPTNITVTTKSKVTLNEPRLVESVTHRRTITNTFGSGNNADRQLSEVNYGETDIKKLNRTNKNVTINDNIVEKHINNVSIVKLSSESIERMAHNNENATTLQNQMSWLYSSPDGSIESMQIMKRQQQLSVNLKYNWERIFLNRLFAVMSLLFLIVGLYMYRFNKSKVTLMSKTLVDEVNSKMDDIRNETCLCQALSFLIWLIHFIAGEAIINQIRVCASSEYDQFNVLLRFFPSLWASITTICFFFIFWQNGLRKKLTMHFVYVIAFLVCLLFGQDNGIIDSLLSSALLKLFFMAIFLNILPWLVSARLLILTSPSPCTFSQRFCLGMISGKMAGAFFFYNFIDYSSKSHQINRTKLAASDNGKFSDKTNTTSWHNCVSATQPNVEWLAVFSLAVGYILFIFLSYSAQKLSRQSQIIQLSKEINGRPVKFSGKRNRRKRPTKNGQYTALLNSKESFTKRRGCTTIGESNDVKDECTEDNDIEMAVMMGVTSAENDTTDDEMSDIEANYTVRNY